jgi:hypothetical protein
MGWAALAYALCAMSLAYPALAGGFLVTPQSDQYIAGYAFRELAAQSLRETGSFPQWNPYLFGGMPYIAAMHGDIFYPTFLLRMILPTDVAMTWSFILHVFLAGLCTYGFLRASGIGFWGSLVAGAAYMLDGNIAGLVSPGHDGKLFLAALLPLSLWIVHIGVRQGRHWAWGALAIVIGFAVLSPHPQVLQYLLVALGAYGLFVAFSADDSGRLERSVAIRRLAAAAVAIVIGGVIGAIQYVPVMEYVPWSPRAGGKGWEHAVSFSLPTEEMFNFFLPHFSGILEKYWGRNGIHFHSDYIGASVLILAGLAFGSYVSPARRRFVFFWLGVFIVSLLWALGGSTPFYHIIYAIVPGTKFFRAPSAMLFVVSFSVTVLAAAGVERALARQMSRRYAIIWLAIAAGIAVLATTGGLTNVASALAIPQQVDKVQANAADLVAGAWRTFVFAAATAGLLIVLASGRLETRAAGIALACIVAADLWSVLRLYWRFSQPAAVIYRSDPTIDYLKKLPQPARVLALAIPDRPVAYHDPVLVGDALMSHSVRQVLGYHGNELGRYDAMLSAGGMNQIFNPNFWRLSNTEYVLTNLDSLPLAGAQRVAGPTTDAAGTTVSLFRLPVEAPFAWVTPLIVKAADDAVMGTVLDPRFDIRRVALFDTAAAVEGKTVPQTLPEPLTVGVRTTSYAAGRIALTLDRPAPEGSALVASENYYPGWKATVDGAPASIGRADGTLIGVPLTAGATRVELTFDSVTYQRGKWLTMGALLLATSLWLGGLVVDRRRRA